MSGKMTRACDCCLRKRARWYCLADDAFLCQSCDGSVHSANPFARRHDRVRLKTSFFKPQRPHLPSWHRGSTQKARTPRKSGLRISKSEERTGPNPNLLYAVPELGAEETTSSHDDEAEDKLLHRVPTLDPFVAEICSSTSTSSGPTGSGAVMSQMIGSPQDGYLPSDMYLEEFAADVETLLGKGLDDESCGIEELGLLDCGNITTASSNSGKDNNNPMDFLKPVKAEENELGSITDKGGVMIRADRDDVVIKEPFDFSFDSYDDDDDHPIGVGEDHEDQKFGFYKPLMGSGVADYNDLLSKVEDEEREKEVVMKRRKILLRLDYEAISEAWATQGSPWMNGQRPEIRPDDCWPHFMGTCRGQMMHHPLNVDKEMGGLGVIGDGGREARVSRYREKRRTRLFAKKIRYEVRKLNAEKRPRMKGRFVKRSSFAQATSPPNSICI